MINCLTQDRDTRNFRMETVNIELPQTLAQICKEHGSRFIHVSCMLATPTSQSKFYRCKWQGENHLRKHFPEATIVRTATLYGHEDRFINLIGALYKLALGHPIVRFDAIRHPLYVGDLAEALKRIALTEDLVPRTFEAYGPEKLTMYRILEIFNHYTFRQVPITKLSPRLFWLYSKMYPEFRRSIIPFDLIHGLKEDELINEEYGKLTDLGITETKPLSKTMLEYVRIFRPLHSIEVIVDELPLEPTSEVIRASRVIKE